MRTDTGNLWIGHQPDDLREFFKEKFQYLKRQMKATIEVFGRSKYFPVCSSKPIRLIYDTTNLKSILQHTCNMLCFSRQCYHSCIVVGCFRTVLVYIYLHVWI